MKFALGIGIAVTALALSQGAQAYQAFITSGGAMLAGPGTGYPPVADISGGEPVELFGCVEGYGWCDVSFRGYRGWFDGRLLTYPYEGQRVPLSGFGGEVGIPVVAFSLEDYWGRFYRDRPFYRDRARWGAGAVAGAPGAYTQTGPHLPPTPQLQPHPPSHRDERPQLPPR